MRQQIRNITTAFNIVSALSFPSLYDVKKTDGKYDNIIAKYQDAIPMTGRLTRERDEINGIEIEKGDLEKVRTKISLKFKKNNDGKMSIMELVKHHKSSLVAAVREALD